MDAYVARGGGVWLDALPVEKDTAYSHHEFHEESN